MSPEEIAQHLEQHASPLSDHELNERWEACLDECHSPYRIGQITYYPSQILRKCDPVAYRCGMNDWLDSDDSMIEIAGQWYALESVNECLESLESDRPELSDVIQDWIKANL